jgi:proteasome lid subunit RPN8/RPN11
MMRSLSEKALTEITDEARAEMKAEIVEYLRDCAEQHGCPGPESRALNRFADNIENNIDP